MRVTSYTMDLRITRRHLPNGTEGRSCAYAGGPFHLCDLYKVTPPPFSISYASVGKYPQPATAEHCAYRPDQASAVGRLSARCDAHIARNNAMLDVLDVILLAGGVGFFALSIAYALACDRL
jgi:hypothetical protein